MPALTAAAQVLSTSGEDEAGASSSEDTTAVTAAVSKQPRVRELAESLLASFDGSEENSCPLVRCFVQAAAALSALSSRDVPIGELAEEVWWHLMQASEQLRRALIIFPREVREVKVQTFLGGTAHICVIGTSVKSTWICGSACIV